MHDDLTLDRRAGMSGRLLFVLSLWMSLAIAIVCAVVPAGLPSTRSIGSAFDPSTTIVALRSKPPVAAKAVLARPDDGAGLGGLGGSGALLPADSAVIGAAAFVLPPLGFSGTIALLIPRAIDIALYARPPPAD